MSCCDPCVPLLQLPVHAMVAADACGCVFKKKPPMPEPCACMPLPLNTVMECLICLPCCATKETGGMASPAICRMLQPMQRYMMNGMMQVTEDPTKDATYKEVQDFMNPESVGKPFVDAPGTFKPGMEPRYKEMGMGMFGINSMRMERKGMKAEGGINAKGITYEKFAEHRGYALPGYKPAYPMDGAAAPDGKIYSIDGSETQSTLLAEAKKVAAAAKSDKVIIAFDGMTCPFYRAYAMQDLYGVSKGVPKLHVYIREAEPCDQFDAGGMHLETPLRFKRPIPVHKSLADRALAAGDCKTFLEGAGVGNCKGPVTMFMDGMDDALEAAYEARPWRWYVIDVTTGKVITSTGLAPFNMAGKLAKIESACSGVGGAKAMV